MKQPCILLLGLLAMFSVIDCRAGTNEELYGGEVRYQRATCEGEFPREEVLLATVTQHHTVFTPEAVRQSIQNIYLLGLFSAVEVDAEPFLDGVMVTYKLQRRMLVRQVRIKRNASLTGRVMQVLHPVSNKDLYRVCNVRPFDDFNEAALIKGVANIQKLLRQKGFSRNSVKYRYAFDYQDYSVKVRFIVDLGPMAVIESIDFVGDAPLPEQYLRRAMALHEGAGYSKDVLDKDRERIAEFCRFYGYLDAEVESPVVSYDEKKDTVRIVIPITTGPPLRVDIAYPLHLWNWDWVFHYLDRTKLNDILDLPHTSAIDLPVLDQGRDTIAAHFMAHGYHFADVDLVDKSDLDDPVQRVVYKVDQGTKVRVRTMTMHGVENLSQEDLASAVLTRRKRRFVMDTLLQDLTALKALYNERGFSDAVIAEPVVEFSDDRQWADVVVAVEEGVRYRIGEVVIEGCTVFDEAEARAAIHLAGEEPVNPQAVNEAAKLLTQMYEAKGYKDVAVTTELAPSQAPNRRDVVVRISEGAAYTFGKVIYRGYFKTKRKVIDRYNKVREGKPYMYDVLLESNRAVSSLGLFQSVRFQPVKWEEAGTARTVVLSVTERPTSRVEFGLGYNTDEGVRGFLDTYTSNLGGYNRTAGFSLLNSQKERKLQFSFKEPFFANTKINFVTRLYRHDIDKPDIEIGKEGAGVTWEKQLSKQLSVLFGLRVESQRVNLLNLDEDIDPRDRADLRVVALGPSGIYDTRDDPRMPRKGILATLTMEYAPKFLDSEVAFPRSTGQLAGFIPLSDNTVLALSLRYGAGYKLPITESFFTGGAKSVRGFRYESLHPPDLEDGTPVPGSSLVIGNIELRYPLLWGLQGVLFLDGGGVWREVSDMDIDGFRETAGAGLRFATPIGPIGIDYGYKLDRKSGETSGRTEVSIGHAF
ncbi:BamA/TamA family outer membrane protein [bacterium]|nr:BamA/TamA family outer membrane protein [candidate division CSSED10-310 bacterium]